MARKVGDGKEFRALKIQPSFNGDNDDFIPGFYISLTLSTTCQPQGRTNNETDNELACLNSEAMPRKPPQKGKETSPALDPTALPTPALESKSIRMTYRIARGEQGVLTFEPYKSLLLPHWRFRTLPIATNSSIALKQAFDHYVKVGDFVGADMARKFVQMGMTRAKRYATHKGGRKYDRSEKEVREGGGERTELEKSTGHEGREEKLAASEIFKATWRVCTGDEKYLKLKEEFVAEQKQWDRVQKRVKKEEG